LGGNGGSGIVILRFRGPMPTIDPGLVYSESTFAGDTVLEFTAGSGVIYW
jgi:hypothetical protein